MYNGERDYGMEAAQEESLREAKVKILGLSNKLDAIQEIIDEFKAGTMGSIDRACVVDDIIEVLDECIQQ